jgi:hypothetical protein
MTGFEDNPFIISWENNENGNRQVKSAKMIDFLIDIIRVID